MQYKLLARTTWQGSLYTVVCYNKIKWGKLEGQTPHVVQCKKGSIYPKMQSVDPSIFSVDPKIVYVDPNNILKLLYYISTIYPTIYTDSSPHQYHRSILYIVSLSQKIYCGFHYYLKPLFQSITPNARPITMHTVTIIDVNFN